jgi:hypothetical protein
MVNAFKFITLDQCIARLLARPLSAPKHQLLLVQGIRYVTYSHLVPAELSCFLLYLVVWSCVVHS